jgi:hypothetical protein
MIILGRKLINICKKIYKIKFQSYMGLIYGKGIDFY